MKSHQLINQTSGDVEYYTPSRIIAAAWQTMGGIDLDPASSFEANKRVRAKSYYVEGDDGLSHVWHGRVWLNHPFGRQTNAMWIAKLVHDFGNGNVTAACCITFACTSERWFQPLMEYPQCFLHPRTNYLLPDGTVKRGVTKGSVVTYLGPDLAGFARHFASLGAIKTIYP